MSSPESERLKKELDELEQKMHSAESQHTLDEHVADMKRRGIDPSETYQKWDDDEEEEDWGNEAWKKNGEWKKKTPCDLDEKARESWDGDSGKPNPPPFV